MSPFAIGEHDFLLDGQPHRILSGAIHYFRIHPQQWAERIHQAKLMGLNTIETYIPWNAHEPVAGQWSWQGGTGPWSATFKGGLDLAAFLETVAAAGMHAIVRPGPYICAEWDNGGLPAWLFADGKARVRHDEAHYMAAVQTYLTRVYKVIAPLQIDRGGPVILVQIENEYGAYSHDKGYLRRLVEITREAGITVPLTTVDQPRDDWQEAGSLPGLHHTASFGSRSLEAMKTLRRHQPTGPLMAMEYWDGWFDDWGTAHHTTDIATSAANLDDLLSTGASVNLYVFCGGTNFGLTNGANHEGEYKPLITSYDYDAPLDEAGNPTAKYWAFREVIARHTEPAEETPGSAALPAPALSADFSQETDLIEKLSASGRWRREDRLPTMDQMGQFRGFALYRTEVDLKEVAELVVREVRDRALVFAGGRPVGVLSRQDEVTSVTLPVGRCDLTLLVEDQGRINYADRIGEPKGLIGPALLRPTASVDTDETELTDWSYLAVPEDLPRLITLNGSGPGTQAAASTHHGRPVLRRGTLTAPTRHDLFLDTTGWGKGLAWFNGICLGRFWERGPQRTLYVPAPLVRAADNGPDNQPTQTNEIVVMDLHPHPGATITTLPAPILDAPIQTCPIRTDVTSRSR